jgi:hypothetical protein
MYGRANGNFREARNLYTVHNTENHPVNYSQNFTSDWANEGPLVKGKSFFFNVLCTDSRTLNKTVSLKSITLCQFLTPDD